MSTSAFEPRPYQTESITATHTDWSNGINPTAVVLPTGMGKTVCFAHLIRDNPTGKSLVLVHRDELVQQAAKKIRSIAPNLEVGIVKAEHNDIHAQVIVGSVQTLRRPNRRAPITDVSMVIVDEAHHAAADSYVAVMDHFGCFNGTRTVGFSATLSRNDHKALGDVFKGVAYEQGIMYGILRGYLVPPRGKQITVAGLDLRGVARTHGDLQDASLGDALIASNAGEVIAAAYLEHSPGKRAVVFCPSVASAVDIAHDMHTAGIPTEVVTGTTPLDVRAEIYDRFERGETQVLCNCMVLTEGWDAPHAEVAIIARATTSKGLYIQMVGRVLRPNPATDKVEALILDVVGVTAMHDLASLTDLTGGEVQVRDGESLVEAAERQKKEGDRRKAVGAIASINVDLFKASASVWLKTHGGIWFIPVREGTYVISDHDGDGSWAVGRFPKSGKAERLYSDLTFDAAMQWAEYDARQEDKSISTKKSSWRSKPPSEAQCDVALKLGIKDPKSYRCGTLSDQISVTIASRRLDRLFKKVPPTR